MPALDGRTIALLESRRGAELDALVRQAGGTPVRAASVREVARPDDVARFAEGLAGDRFDVVVFLTGAGVHALLDDSVDGTVAALRRCTVASRGPKPLAALKRYGVAAHVMTAKLHPDELVDSLARIDLVRRRVALVHYGAQSVAGAALRGMGARVTDICAYEWMLPDDVEPLVLLVDKLLAGDVDALLVTSQIQYRHLCEVAACADREQRLNIALRTDVVVGAIGPICADAIRRSGVIPDVMPETPNLPSLVERWVITLN
jgi:uroporphyrinogen-III synthase